MNYIYENHQQRLTNWNQTFLNPAKLEEYAQAISDRGAALKNCFGFIDGTVRPICRPDQNQRVVYNGLKIVHGLKFNLFHCLMECLQTPMDHLVKLY